jgi:hypothetical protein
MKLLALKFRISALMPILALAFVMYNCDGGNNVEQQIDENMEDQEVVDEFNKAKQVFYSLPSPIETAMLLKRAGAKFNPQFLNKVENLANYTTNRSMALNFASMFDQKQFSTKYLAATKKLADELGILNAIDQSYIDRMESNLNNRDSLMEIISETFMNSNSFLKENDRAEIAGIILSGGWIEGLYLATQIAQTTPSNKEIVDRIIDQSLSLSTLISMLSEYPNDENVKSVLPDLERIKVIFDKVVVSKSKIEAVEGADGKTILKTESSASISPETLTELYKAVDEIRTNITK